MLSLNPILKRSRDHPRSRPACRRTSLNDPPLTGLERLRAGLGSLGAEVPFNRTFPMTRVGVEFGASEALLAPVELTDGFDRLGLLGHIVALADHTLGNAALSTLAAGEIAVSMSLRVDLQQSAPPLGQLTCRGRRVDRALETALAEGEISASGQAVGRAVLRSFVLRQGQRGPTRSRPTQDGITADRNFERTCSADLGLGLHWFTACPAVKYEATADGVRFQCRPDTALTNSLGILHGGAASILLDLAGAVAVRSKIGGGSTRPLDFSIQFVRPTRAALVEARATLTQITKSTVAVGHELRDADGRITALATSTRLRIPPPHPSSGDADVPTSRRE
jgi:uncharacterized protein (TIGR00369 family)